VTRVLLLAYGLLAYVVFLASFSWAAWFVARGMDPVGSAWFPAIAVDAALLALFALQHSGMARARFKARWTRIVHPAIERSTYVLAASASVAAIVGWWQPLPGVLWDLRGGAGEVALFALQAAGWATVLASSFLIDHFELFGLAQVWRHGTGKAAGTPRLRTPFLYRFVRHPLMLGTLVAMWAAPLMNGSRLFFAGMATLYVVLALGLEERDLIRAHGWDYEAYRRRVPRLLPWPRPRAR
jgi:protein-S-isoprenylcysteine O-methyltransferase Ste14